MEKRRLSCSDLKTSVIGFGSWGIGGATTGATSYGSTNDEHSLAALRRAFKSGINFFDTAPAYGDGHSERLIGRLIAEIDRGSIIVATKGGCEKFNEKQDFSLESLYQGLNRSLNRLGTDYVDLYQLHNPPVEVLRNAKNLVGFVNDLKRQGKARLFGISLHRPNDGLIALDEIELDTLQVNFNLLDQRALDIGLFERAIHTNTGIIARTPLCFGFLSGKIDLTREFSPQDHRSQWSREQIISWIKIGRTLIKQVENCAVSSAAQIALRFCLSFPVIAVTIPGMILSSEVDENAAAGILGSLSTKEIKLIRDAYRKQPTFVDNRPKRGTTP